MPKRRWQVRIGLLFLSLALVTILNPEVRALFLIVDAIGLDLVILLVATQLRAVAPFLSPWLALFGGVTSSAGVYAYRSILPTLLYMIAPRLMPALLVLLLFICAACELHLAGDWKNRAVGA